MCRVGSPESSKADTVQGACRQCWHANNSFWKEVQGASDNSWVLLIYVTPCVCAFVRGP